MTEEKAKDVMERLQTRMAWTAFEMEKSGLKLNLSGAAGVAAYTHNGAGQSELLTNASQALQKAEATGYGKVSLYAEGEHTDNSQS
jgi:PleD family two-component response regulator